MLNTVGNTFFLRYDPHFKGDKIEMLQLTVV